MSSGPVIGTGQDEWYNMMRGLRALYEHLNPTYFIHPALYYELLAGVFGIQRLVLAVSGRLGDLGFLDYFLASETHFLTLARSLSLASGALAVMAAVWLGTSLSGIGAGMLAGTVIASLPLLQTLATAIRVDALALATIIAGAALVVRSYRDPSRRSLLLAAVGIGVAAAANYPGALLLLLLAWAEWARDRSAGLPSRARRLAVACLVAGAAFLLLNPYVILNPRLFLAWFFFQAKLPLLIHPHAEEPSLTRYLDVIIDQGPAAIAACLAGLAALSAVRQPTGALAIFGVAYLIAFSVMRTQYDRFVLPAIALLCIAGAAWLCELLRRRVADAAARRFVILAVPAILWWADARTMRIEPNPERVDYRAEMFDWIAHNVPPSATLVIESDTLPLVQTVYDPGADGRRFESGLRAAFEKRHPHLAQKIVKAQYIAAVYNYEPAQLDGERVFFLASSQNREFIAVNRAVLSEPAAFYDALDRRASVVHESAGIRERLLLYATRAGS